MVSAPRVTAPLGLQREAFTPADIFDTTRNAITHGGRLTADRELNRTTKAAAFIGFSIGPMHLVGGLPRTMAEAIAGIKSGSKSTTLDARS
jgi:hypothetical protein